MHERGKKYYDEDRVKDIILKDNFYYATVVGSRNYKVMVELIDNEIIKTTCNCPYEGFICKHQVAVYYKIMDLLNLNEKTIFIEEIKKELEKIKKEDLIQLLFEFYVQDKYKLYKFVVENIKEHALLAVKKMLEYYNFHTVHELEENTFQNLDNIINDIFSMLSLDEENFKVNLEIVFYIISYLEKHERESYYEYVDETTEEIMATVFNYLRTLLEDIEDEEKIKKAFLKIKKNLDLYKEKDYIVLGIIESTISLCKYSFIKEYYDCFLDEKIISYEEDEVDNFDFIPSVYITKYNIIKMFDGEERRKEYLNKNIKFGIFRKILIEEAYQNKNYEDVIILCEEYLNGGKSFYNDYFEEFLYEALKETKNINKLKVFLDEQVLKGKTSKYYDEYKKLLKKDEWDIKLKEILKVLKNDSEYAYEYFDILAKENLLKELIFYCEKYPQIMYKYYPYCIKNEEYREKVIEIIERDIERNIAISSNRKSYLNLFYKIKVLKDIYGFERVIMYFEKLKEKYPKRRAMIQVLSEFEERLKN